VRKALIKPTHAWAIDEAKDGINRHVSVYVFEEDVVLDIKSKFPEDAQDTKTRLVLTLDGLALLLHALKPLEDGSFIDHPYHESQQPEGAAS
jgi:hypothetical protein